MSKRRRAVSQTSGYVLTGLGAKWYDPGNSLFGARLINKKHVQCIKLQPGDRLLDVGCGTAEIMKQLCCHYPKTASIYGIDPSPDMLEVARRKLQKWRNACIAWAVGEHLPFADHTFDWVVTSLTMHHLPAGLKTAVAIECRRVLQPHGRLLVSDFGRPTKRLGTFFATLWEGHAFTSENLRGAIPEAIADAGFQIESIHVQAGIIHHVLATPQSTE